MDILRGIYTIWYRDLLRFWHDKMRMLGTIILPLLFLFVFGSGLSASMGLLGPGIDFAQFMFPGIIGMTVIMNSFMGGISVVWDREFGFLKEVLVAPINRSSVTIGKMLGSATIALIQGTIILIFAPVIGVSLSGWVILKLLPLMFLLAACLGSFGVLLGTRIKSMEAFQAIMPMLMFPMIFLSGIFFPMQGLPAWMNVLVKINPAAYGVTPIRQVVLGTSEGTYFGITLFGYTLSIWQDVAIVAAFGAVMLVLAMWSFSHQE
jgi:ABC-2 type transport system permease protein